MIHSKLHLSEWYISYSCGLHVTLLGIILTFLWFHYPNANIYVSEAYCQYYVLFCTYSQVFLIIIIIFYPKSCLCSRC